MSDLAKRAVACKHWRWMPGMLTRPFHEDDDRTRAVCHPPWRVMHPGVAGPWAGDPAWGALPDLDDPATLGCLLALVREAWGDPVACVWCGSDRAYWEVTSAPMGPLPHHMLGFGSTEAEALVAALEAAP